MRFGLVFLSMVGMLLLGCSEGVSVGAGNGSGQNGGNGGNGGVNGGNGSNSGQGETEDCKNIDLMTSAQNCGSCGFSCKHGTCSGGQCTCDEGYLDCDGDGACETRGECDCELGAQRECYSHDPETLKHGNCHEGVQTCEGNEYGAFWGDCVGELGPSYVSYVCESNSTQDIDCNGIPDSQQDEDGDHYYFCAPEGLADCCDNYMMCPTSQSERVKPENMLDCRGNGIDDDCDGIVDEDSIDCDTGVTYGYISACDERPQSTEGCAKEGDYRELRYAEASPKNGLLLARAMDMCREEVVDSKSSKPGIIEATVTQSGRTGNVTGFQINVLSGMRNTSGTEVFHAREGGSMALLSTGVASDAMGIYAFERDVMESSQPEFPQDMRCSSAGIIPAIYSKVHNGQLQSHEKCDVNDEINDSVQLHLKLRAPQDAMGFSFEFRFFTREFPYYVCSEYNDFFMAILTDENGKPLFDINGNERLDDEDGNISFDQNRNPISVNNAFFTTCTSAPCNSDFHSSSHTGCPATLSCMNSSCGTCPNGYEDLMGFTPTPYYKQTQNSQLYRGGATAWLETRAPIQPGQVFNLDFYLWDTGDNSFDSIVLLDNFKWRCDPTSRVETIFAESNAN